MVFTRRTEHIERNSYKDDEFVSMECLKQRVADFRKLRQPLKLKLLRETNELLYSEDLAFQVKLKKYLYELKAHPHMQGKYEKALALVTKFRNQKPPQNYTRTQYDEFQKRNSPMPRCWQ